MAVKNLSQPLIVAGDAIKTYEDMIAKSNKADTATENRGQIIKTKQYIKKHFFTIIPGHDVVLVNGHKSSQVTDFFKF